jgi:hypothetical protein
MASDAKTPCITRNGCPGTDAKRYASLISFGGAALVGKAVAGALKKTTTTLVSVSSA